MTGPAFRVEGVKEAKAALAELGRAEERKEFTKAYRKISDMAASDIRKSIPLGPAKGGHARDGVKARASKAGAAVVIPRRTVPYYGWLDFGSRTPNVGAPRSIGPWKQSGFGPEKGRFAYPTIERNYEKYVDATDDAMREVVRDLKLL